MALYAAIAVVVFVIVGIIAWKLIGTGPQVGYVQISATPWAEIQSVQTDAGKPVELTGQTPLQAALPPGTYEVTLKSGSRVEKVTVEVKAGEVSSKSVVFPDFKVDSVVDELVSKY